MHISTLDKRDGQVFIYGNLNLAPSYIFRKVRGFSEGTDGFAPQTCPSCSETLNHLSGPYPPAYVVPGDNIVIHKVLWEKSI